MWFLPCASRTAPRRPASIRLVSRDLSRLPSPPFPVLARCPIFTRQYRTEDQAFRKLRLEHRRSAARRKPSIRARLFATPRAALPALSIVRPGSLLPIRLLDKAAEYMQAAWVRSMPTEDQARRTAINHMLSRFTAAATESANWWRGAVPRHLI